MPSERVLSALNDIRDNIDVALVFAEGSERNSFGSDKRTFYAAVRCLEIISEASRRLPADLKERHPSIPWRRIADAGNVYRHDYGGLAPQRVWDTLQLALPPLRAVIISEIASLGE